MTYKSDFDGAWSCIVRCCCQGIVYQLSEGKSCGVEMDQVALNIYVVVLITITGERGGGGGVLPYTV